MSPMRGILNVACLAPFLVVAQTSGEQAERESAIEVRRQSPQVFAGQVGTPQVPLPMRSERSVRRIDASGIIAAAEEDSASRPVSHIPGSRLEGSGHANGHARAADSYNPYGQPPQTMDASPHSLHHSISGPHNDVAHKRKLHTNPMPTALPLDVSQQTISKAMEKISEAYGLLGLFARYSLGAEARGRTAEGTSVETEPAEGTPVAVSSPATTGESGTVTDSSEVAPLQQTTDAAAGTVPETIVTGGTSGASVTVGDNTEVAEAATATAAPAPEEATVTTDSTVAAAATAEPVVVQSYPQTTKTGRAQQQPIVAQPVEQATIYRYRVTTSPTASPTDEPGWIWGRSSLAGIDAAVSDTSPERRFMTPSA